MHKKGIAPTGKNHPVFLWIVGIIIILVLMKSCGGGDEGSPDEPDTPPTTQQTPAAPPVAQLPTKVRGETPATITADYGFSLEANGPIMVQYPGEEPFLFTPAGNDCQQLHQPRRSGPKKFWDPDDPEEGHISFRIYRGLGECVVRP